jgi:hypothetical protein
MNSTPFCALVLTGRPITRVTSAFVMPRDMSLILEELVAHPDNKTAATTNTLANFILALAAGSDLDFYRMTASLSYPRSISLEFLR